VVRADGGAGKMPEIMSHEEVQVSHAQPAIGKESNRYTCGR